MDYQDFLKSPHHKQISYALVKSMYGTYTLFRTPRLFTIYMKIPVIPYGKPTG